MSVNYFKFLIILSILSAVAAFDCASLKPPANCHECISKVSIVRSCRYNIADKKCEEPSVLGLGNNPNRITTFDKCPDQAFTGPYTVLKTAPTIFGLELEDKEFTIKAARALQGQIQPDDFVLKPSLRVARADEFKDIWQSPTHDDTQNIHCKVSVDIESRINPDDNCETGTLMGSGLWAPELDVRIPVDMTNQNANLRLTTCFCPFYDKLFTKDKGSAKDVGKNCRIDTGNTKDWIDVTGLNNVHWHKPLGIMTSVTTNSKFIDDLYLQINFKGSIYHWIKLLRSDYNDQRQWAGLTDFIFSKTIGKMSKINNKDITPIAKDYIYMIIHVITCATGLNSNGGNSGEFKDTLNIYPKLKFNDMVSESGFTIDEIKEVFDKIPDEMYTGELDTLDDDSKNRVSRITNVKDKFNSMKTANTLNGLIDCTYLHRLNGAPAVNAHLFLIEVRRNRGSIKLTRNIGIDFTHDPPVQNTCKLSFFSYKYLNDLYLKMNE